MIKLGTIVKPWGKVKAVGVIEGERYYWLTLGNLVSMIPANVVEGATVESAEAIQAKEGG